MRFTVALLMCAGLILGCGEDDEPATAPAGVADLVVEYDADGEGGDDPTPVEVRCDASEDCEDIAAVKPEAFEPTPGDVACTQQYGGPETATRQGHVHG